MNTLRDKIVFITGASSGIGKACAEQLSAQGALLILTARRLDLLESLADELKNKNGTQSLTFKMDVSNKKEVSEAIANLPAEWKNIDILVNNAGLALATDKFQDCSLENWDTMIDANLRGLLYVTYAILPTMISRNKGHIVNMGSIAGRESYPGGNVYSATKHAVSSLNKSLRIDLLGSALRVTEIAPGAVDTAFSEVRWGDKKRADKFYSEFSPLHAEDIADAVVYVTTRPEHVNVSEMIVLPTCQASANHIDKK